MNRRGEKEKWGIREGRLWFIGEKYKRGRVWEEG